MSPITGWASNESQTSTTTTGEEFGFNGPLIRLVYYSDYNSPTATDPVVQIPTTYSTSNVTWVSPVDPLDFAPTKWELNRIAAMDGAHAERKKHSRIPKKALVLRSSYQGMARLPCYRGTRPR